MENDGTALQYASEALKKDMEIVKIAVDKNPETLVFASEKL